MYDLNLVIRDIFRVYDLLDPTALRNEAFLEKAISRLLFKGEDDAVRCAVTVLLFFKKQKCKSIARSERLGRRINIDAIFSCEPSAVFLGCRVDLVVFPNSFEAFLRRYMNINRLRLPSP